MSDVDINNFKVYLEKVDVPYCCGRVSTVVKKLARDFYEVSCSNPKHNSIHTFSPIDRIHEENTKHVIARFFRKHLPVGFAEELVRRINSAKSMSEVWPIELQ